MTTLTPASTLRDSSHNVAKQLTSDPRLISIRQRALAGQRLSLDDGMVLYSSPDVHSVIAMASELRDRLHPGVAFYNVNRHMNYSNVCALSCKFCEFYRKDGQDGAYTRDMEYVANQAKLAVESGATEMHMVGGLHPKLPFSYYTDLIRTVRSTAQALGSDLHVKAFTAVEIVHLAKIAKVFKQDDRAAGIRWVLKALQEAGLGSLPGGGAEVFDDRIHDEAYKGKIRSDVWLDVHRVAHELGLNSNATLLYGHIEQRADRLVHLDMLRRAQDMALARLGYAGSGQNSGWSGDQTSNGHLGASDDPGMGAPVITLTKPGTVLPERFALNADGSAKSGYFQTIIPLPFFPDGSELEHLSGPSGLENLRTIAVARLMLDNFPHVKAFWIMQTLPMAQLMLQSGADDIDGTVVWYDITKVNHGLGQGTAAGESTMTHQEVSSWTLQKAIREAGFAPVERDTLYRPIARDGVRWWAK
jgi:aminodeoxyfutalosine synthase